MDLQDLIKSGDVDLLPKAQTALAATPSRHLRAEVAYSGLLWLEAYSGRTPVCLRVLQGKAGADQRARLSQDLAALGLSASSDAVAQMVAFADARYAADKAFSPRPYTKVLADQMEAGDTLLNHAKDLMKDHPDTAEDVSAAIKGYLTEHAFAFEGITVPEKRKGLFGRLFG